MSRWVEVVRRSEIPLGEGRTVRTGGKCLAVFNDGGEYFAIDDACPHEGASLGEGILHDGCVICPLHSWVFELRSGQCPRGTHAGVSTYSARLAGDFIEVELAEDAAG